MYLERDASHDIQRVNDIPQTLAHLPAMSISHHRMEVHLTKRWGSLKREKRREREGREVLESNLREWDLSHDLLSKEHHPGHPEEENVMTSLQQGVWIESLQIFCLNRQVERERERDSHFHQGSCRHSPGQASQIWKRGGAQMRTRYPIHLRLTTEISGHDSLQDKLAVPCFRTIFSLEMLNFLAALSSAASSDAALQGAKYRGQSTEYMVQFTLTSPKTLLLLAKNGINS